MNKITIDLGKGVELSAPIKLNMTVEEWTRMSRFVNSYIRNSKR